MKLQPNTRSYILQFIKTYEYIYESTYKNKNPIENYSDSGL